MNIRTNKKNIFFAAGVGLCLLAPFTANAGCKQGDMTGTWYSYSMSDDSAGFLFPHTNYCKVKINSSGSIVASKSTCKTRISSGLITTNVTGGKLKVNSSCSLSGNINLSNAFGTDKIIVEYGTLASDKKTLSSVLYSDNDNTFVTSLNAVKK